MIGYSMVCGHAPATLPTEREFPVGRWLRPRVGLSFPCCDFVTQFVGAVQRVACWLWRIASRSWLANYCNGSKTVAGRFLTLWVTYQVGGVWLSRLDESQTWRPQAVTAKFTVVIFLLRLVPMSREKRLLALSCPSVREHQRHSHWTDFRDVWYRGHLKKSIDKLQISFKWDTNIGHLTCRYGGTLCCCWRQCIAVAVLSSNKMVSGC